MLYEVRHDSPFIKMRTVVTWQQLPTWAREAIADDGKYASLSLFVSGKELGDQKVTKITALVGESEVA